MLPNTSLQKALLLVCGAAAICLYILSSLQSFHLMNGSNNQDSDFIATLLRTSRSGLDPPMGDAVALPSIRVQDKLTEGRFGGEGDVKNLGGFTDMSNPSLFAAGPGSDDASMNGNENASFKKYAYVYLMASCDSTKSALMGYVYNILVSAHILHQSGSTSDIVVLVQMAVKSKEIHLSPHIENLLQASHIIIKYLPKGKIDNFYSATLGKFAILDLTAYARVLFMDSDIMPLCNLDYMFHLSAEGSLRENVILAYSSEPAQGGFFLLQPNHTDYLIILKIQRERLKRGDDIAYGWGHTIQSPDEWVTINRAKWGTKWTFHGALADQGLLYYWTKYFKKSVSIINANKVETWSASSETNNTVKMINVQYDIFGLGCASSLPNKYRRPLLIPQGFPYDDFVHFTGRSKPWLKIEKSDASKFWFHILREVAKNSNISLDVEAIHITEHNPGGHLGWPSPFQVQQIIEAEEIRGEDGDIPQLLSSY